MNIHLEQRDGGDLGRYRPDPHSLPEGFDTVAGYVAKNDPGLFEYLTGDPVLSLLEDERALADRAARWGIPALPVPASPAYVSRGIEQQTAFPASLIVSLYEGPLA
jgi:hypothetical protein